MVVVPLNVLALPRVTVPESAVRKLPPLPSSEMMPLRVTLLPSVRITMRAPEAMTIWLATLDRLVLILKAPAVTEDELSSERRIPPPNDALSSMLTLGVSPDEPTVPRVTTPEKVLAPERVSPESRPLPVTTTPPAPETAVLIQMSLAPPKATFTVTLPPLRTKSFGKAPLGSLGKYAPLPSNPLVWKNVPPASVTGPVPNPFLLPRMSEPALAVVPPL